MGNKELLIKVPKQNLSSKNIIEGVLPPSTIINDIITDALYQHASAQLFLSFGRSSRPPEAAFSLLLIFRNELAEKIRETSAVLRNP